jgi:hypothetical protein
MAMPRTWLQRSEEIIAVLRKMKSRHLDRPAIEELFQLQRRAALDLMNQVGTSGTRVTGFLVDRTILITWVERTWQTEAWQLTRRQEVSDELSQSVAEIQAVREAMVREGKKPVPFPLVAEVLGATCASLPSEIRIEHGRITVAVHESAPEEMAIAAYQLLYALAMAIANDTRNFEKLVGGASLPPTLTSLQEMVRSMEIADEPG